MSLQTKTASDSAVIDTWIRSGKPVLSQLKKHSTLALLFGKPETKMVQDTYTGKVMPKITFEGIDKLNLEDGRFFVFPYARDLDAGADTTRGANMLATRSVGSGTDPFDALRFQSSWYVINYDIPNDKLDELKGTKWAMNGTFASNVADAIMRYYLNESSTAIWASGSSSLMPADGVLGSIRAQVSDGIDHTGSGGTDESTYTNFVSGYTRTAAGGHQDFSSSYLQLSGALTVLNLEQAADMAYANGATKLVVPLRHTRFRALEDTIRSTYGQNSLKVDEELCDLGIPSGMQFTIGGITCYVDYDIPAATWVTVLDLPSISAGSEFGKVKTSLIHNPGTVNASVLHGRFRHQVMVTDPRKCTLIEGLSSL